MRRNANIISNEESSLENQLSPTKKKTYSFDIEVVFQIPILIIRSFILLVWGGSMVYVTYRVYSFAQETKNEKMIEASIPQRGYLYSWFHRRRDSTDTEWNTLSNFIFGPYIVWQIIICVSVFVLNHFASQKLRPLLPLIHPALAIGFLIFSVGFTGLQLTYFLMQPVTYWLLWKTRSKFLIWSFSFAFMFLFITPPWTQTFLIPISEDTDQEKMENPPTSVYDALNDQTYLTNYIFMVSVAWNYARCLSYSLDSWDKPKKERNSWKALFSGIYYCLYLPLVVTGPLVLFKEFEENMISHKRQGKDVFNLFTMAKKLLRVTLIAVLCEVCIHYLYFRRMTLDEDFIEKQNIWLLCGCIFWLGQFFTMKYKVIYGVSTCLAEFDGLEMPPLPRCPTYFHRYSVIWKDFDRGLYNFLVRYIYVPSIKTLEKLDSPRVLAVEIHKLIASLGTFFYVYVWHSTSFEIFVWAFCNFLGITFERIGSLIKRKIDKFINIQPIIWDFIIEPFVTAPLAAMSILNTTVFCLNLERGIDIFVRIWTEWANGNFYGFYFMYCLAHIGVWFRNLQSKQMIKTE